MMCDNYCVGCLKQIRADDTIKETALTTLCWARSACVYSRMNQLITNFELRLSS